MISLPKHLHLLEHQLDIQYFACCILEYLIAQLIKVLVQVFQQAIQILLFFISQVQKLLLLSKLCF